jgi:hypothetical protein
MQKFRDLKHGALTGSPTHNGPSIYNERTNPNTPHLAMAGQNFNSSSNNDIKQDVHHKKVFSNFTKLL